MVLLLRSGVGVGVGSAIDGASGDGGDGLPDFLEELPEISGSSMSSRPLRSFAGPKGFSVWQTRPRKDATEAGQERRPA